MTVKDYALKKIMEILEHKCPVVHNVPQRKIYYHVGSLHTVNHAVMSDITDPLLALYYHFADKEDKLWRENIKTKHYHFVRDETKKPFRCYFVDPVTGKRTEIESSTVLEFKKPKVYLSGQITNLSEEEYKRKFKEAEDKLIGLGYDVVNPASLDPIPNGTWTDFMRRDIKLLMDCDYIYMLDNWTESTGAKAEFKLAVDIGIERLTLDK